MECTEAKSGFMWDFWLWRSEKKLSREEIPFPDVGASERAVLRVADDEGIRNKGHVIALDRGYSSPSLYILLGAAGFDVVGTCMVNRRNYPKEVQLSKRAEHGEYKV